MKTSESIKNIAPALLKAQSEMGNAVKDSKNPFFKSKYADLNSIREAVMPQLNANGISVLQPTVFVDGKQFVETVLLHSSGEFMSSMTEVVAAKVNDPQAAGSGISYARRYGLQSFLNVGAEDDDGESAMGRGKSSNSTPANVSKLPAKSEEAPAKSEAKAPEAKATGTDQAAPEQKKRKPFKRADEVPAAPAEESSDSDW